MASLVRGLSGGQTSDVTTFMDGGLKKFIQSIRDCGTDKEAETKRIVKELANIRSKFSTSANLSSYQKKKYVWKLVYIFMLGHEVDFGHMEVISLITSNKYPEKSVGYLATAVLLKSSDDLMTLVVNSIRNDLISADPNSQALALTCIANVGGDELAETLAGDVQRLLVAKGILPLVRKKAALTMCLIVRKIPSAVIDDEFAPQMMNLLGDRHLGLQNSLLSLLLLLAKRDRHFYKECADRCLLLLTQLVAHQGIRTDYLYYKTPSPWLQVKILRLLQLYPPPSDSSSVGRMNETLRKIISKSETKSNNTNNTNNSILFEAVNLIIAHGDKSDTRLRRDVIQLLGKFLVQPKEANLRYLALDSLIRVAATPDSVELVKKKQDAIFKCLGEDDSSIRKRALDLLFEMCDKSNAEAIVDRLVQHLQSTDPSILDEMVLKIAILSEKFAPDLKWYVDTMLHLIKSARENVSDDVWHRVVQIVTNNETLQGYAVKELWTLMKDAGAELNPALIKTGGYLLGEFGFLIAENAGSSGDEQFAVLKEYFMDQTCPPETKGLLLSSFVKMVNLYPHLKDAILPTFEAYQNSWNGELQQRAIEYSALPNIGPELMYTVLDTMPAFPEDKESSLEKRIKEKKSEQGVDDAANDNVDNPLEDDPRFGSGQSAGDQGSTSVNEPQETIADLLDFDQEPTDAVQQPQTAVDILDPLKAQAQQLAPGSIAGLTESDIPSLRRYFKELCGGSTGVLFENEVLKMEIKHEYKGFSGRMAVCFTNKSADDFSQFSSIIPEVQFLKFQHQAPPDVIAVGGQVQHRILMECVQPFETAPQITVSFTAGNGVKHEYLLRLPVVVSCFFEPVVLNGPDFMARWKNLDGREQKETITGTDPQGFKIEWFRTYVVKTLKMGMAVGIDSANSVTAATTFKTATLDQTGSPISVGCLLRIEINPSDPRMCQITVRAVHPTCALGLKNLVKSRIAS